MKLQLPLFLLPILLFALTLTGCGPSLTTEEQAMREAVEELKGSVEIEEGHIVKVLLGETTTTDQDVEKLKGLTKLKHLELRSTKVTAAVFATAQEFGSLEYLDISGTEISEAAARKFEKESGVSVSGPGI